MRIADHDVVIFVDTQTAGPAVAIVRRLPGVAEIVAVAVEGLDARRPVHEVEAVLGIDGDGPGQLSYPYDLAFGKEGELYIVEYGNHRVQKFTPEGESLGCWGGPGRGRGKLSSPWALAVDSRGRVHVVDSENHRVQRIAF